MIANADSRPILRGYNSVILERNADRVNAFGVKKSVHRNLSSASALHDATTIGGVLDSERTRVAPLRVLKVTQSYFPFVERGGPAVKVRSLARGLAKRGHSVSVLTSDLGIEGLSNPAVAIARTNKGWRYHEDGVETRYLRRLGPLSFANLESRDLRVLPQGAGLLRYCSHLRNVRSARSNRGGRVPAKGNSLRARADGDVPPDGSQSGAETGLSPAVWGIGCARGGAAGGDIRSRREGADRRGNSSPEDFSSAKWN